MIEQLLREASHDTAFWSMHGPLLKNPKFRQVIQMGQKAVPVIVTLVYNIHTGDEENKAFGWAPLLALGEILGEDCPAPPEGGNFTAWVKAVVEWGSKRGLCPAPDGR